MRFSSEKDLPGWTLFTKTNQWLQLLRLMPNKKQWFSPILESLKMFERDATPLIREANTSGTAISFSRFTKITPLRFYPVICKLYPTHTGSQKPKQNS